MTKFAMDNNKEGKQRVIRTATGYECVSLWQGEDEHHTFDQRVRFFIRHTVCTEGHACNEIGLSELYADELDIAYRMLIKPLTDAGYEEMSNVEGAMHNDKAFARYMTPDNNIVIARMPARSNAIEDIVGVIAKSIISEDGAQFISGQEHVDDVIFQSLMHILGPELSKSPGGEDSALKRLQKMAHDFKHGIIPTGHQLEAAI